MRAHASWGSENDAMLVFLNQESYDKYNLSKEDYELRKEMGKTSKDTDKEKKKKGTANLVMVEEKGLEDRIVRLTPHSSDLKSAILSPDGESLYYIASYEAGIALWKMDLRKKETKLLHRLSRGWASLETDKEGKNLFLLNGRNMQKLNLANNELEPVTYSATVKMDAAEERAYMFEHIYKQELKRFYDIDMHKVDWKALTEAYRKFLPHISNNYDFAELLSEWLGELNVSHTGGRYSPSLPGERTAQTGLLFDWDYQGAGLRIAEVVEKGPCDKAQTLIRAGVTVEQIDGTAIGPETDASLLLKPSQQGCKNLPRLGRFFHGME